MRVLVACEFSGIVRDAFIERGHAAVSCDLLPSERPGPHLVGDALDYARAWQWDLLIAHPPCTYLANSGVRWLYKDGEPDEDRWMRMADSAPRLSDAPRTSGSGSSGSSSRTGATRSRFPSTSAELWRYSLSSRSRRLSRPAPRTSSGERSIGKYNKYVRVNFT